MLSDDNQSAPTGANGGLSFPRQVEFAQALDSYMTSYITEQQRRLLRSTPTGLFRRLINFAGTPRLTQERARTASAVRVSAALIIEALQLLGSAMSDSGKSPSVGVM